MPCDETKSAGVPKSHKLMSWHANIFSSFIPVHAGKWIRKCHEIYHSYLILKPIHITITLFKARKTFLWFMSIQYHMIQSELTFDLAFWNTWFSISMLFLVVGIPDVRMASSLKNNQFADLRQGLSYNSTIIHTFFLLSLPQKCENSASVYCIYSLTSFT